MTYGLRASVFRNCLTRAVFGRGRLLSLFSSLCSLLGIETIRCFLNCRGNRVLIDALVLKETLVLVDKLRSLVNTLIPHRLTCQSIQRLFHSSGQKCKVVIGRTRRSARSARTT